MTTEAHKHEHRSGLTVDVIMPVYNGREFIVKSLPPLMAMKRSGELQEVIVVDDSSTDDSIEIARNLGATILKTGGRLGPGGGRNQAAETSHSAILWFVDSDVVVHSDAVDHLKQGFDDPSVVAVFGSYDDQPPAKNFLSQYKNLVHHHYHNQGHSDASTFWAGCGAIRRKSFVESGGFDTQTYKRPSIEDIELGYRLKEAGGVIRLIPALKSSHLKVWRLFNLIHTEVFCRAIPWSRLMFTKTGVVDDLNVSSAERFKAVFAGLLLLSLMAAVAGFLSWWWVLALTALAVWSNRILFTLFYKRRGFLFALSGLAFHQIYYLYSGFAFVYSWLEVRLFKSKNQPLA